MNKNHEAKAVVVGDIKKLMENAKSFVLVDYRGLTVEEDTELRRQMRQAGVTYQVLKNTLIRRAAKDLGIEEPMDIHLNGPTAVAFSQNDAIAPVRILSENAKKTKKTSLKIARVEGKYFEADQLDAVAELPSREVLLAKLLGCLNAPLANLLYCLNAISEAKEGPKEAEQTA